MPNGHLSGPPALQGDLLELRARARAVLEITECLLREQRTGSGSSRSAVHVNQIPINIKPIPINVVYDSCHILAVLHDDLQSQCSPKCRRKLRNARIVRKKLAKKLWKGSWAHWVYQRT